MALTELQTDAIARAKRGDFALLDAMELDHRMKNDTDVCAGWLIGGRLRMFSMGQPGDTECFDCDGDGYTPCRVCKGTEVTDCPDCSSGDDYRIEHKECGGHGCEDCDNGKIDCPGCGATGERTCNPCDGMGTVDCATCDGAGEHETDEFTESHIVNLDGTTLWTEGSDEPNPTDGCRMVAREWARQVIAAYHADKKKQADAAPAPIQTPLIPENYSCA